MRFNLVSQLSREVQKLATCVLISLRGSKLNPFGFKPYDVGIDAATMSITISLSYPHKHFTDQNRLHFICRKY